MIGTIASFNGKRASGVISMESGESVCFDAAAVLAYDATSLAAGQQVNFDLANGTPQHAINISIQTFRAIHYSEDRRREIGRLRYMGFEQVGNVRAYRFERTSPGEQKQSYTVDIDLVLFQRHHIVIQEGPALCLHLLSAELEAASANINGLAPCSITEQHILTYMATKPLTGTNGGRKGARRASVPMQHPWVSRS